MKSQMRSPARVTDGWQHSPRSRPVAPNRRPVAWPHMGWCAEFAHRIAHNCDQPMVAGKSSCSCPSCGVVCTGKFPACSEVWARWANPPKVAVSAPARSSATRAPQSTPTTAVANGRPLSLPDHVDQPLDTGQGARIGNGNGAVQQDLLAQMRSISERLEQLSAVAASREPRADDVQGRLLAQLQRLPDDIARGLSAVLREQHQLIMRDVKMALDDVVRQLSNFDSAESS